MHRARGQTRWAHRRRRERRRRLHCADTVAEISIHDAPDHLQDPARHALDNAVVRLILYPKRDVGKGARVRCEHGGHSLNAVVSIRGAFEVDKQPGRAAGELRLRVQDFGKSAERATVVMRACADKRWPATFRASRCTT